MRESERPLSASASGQSLRSYNSLESLNLPTENQLAQRPYVPGTPPYEKMLKPSGSSTDLASSPVTLVSSRSREDLTSPVDWPGTELGGRGGL